MKRTFPLLSLWLCAAGLVWAAFGDGLATAGAPSAEELLRRFVARAARDQDMEAAFAATHAFRIVKTTAVWDGGGDLKKREVKITLHRPDHASEEPEAAPDDEQPGRKRRTYYVRQDFNLTQDFMARFRVAVIGQETVAGRPAWVLDFEPASADLPARSIRDRFLNRCAGRAWLDAEDSTLVKVRLDLVEPINFVGGLVGAVTQFGATFERSRTADGQWYTRAVNWHLTGRKLWARKVMDFKEECQDVEPVPLPAIDTATPEPVVNRLSP